MTVRSSVNGRRVGAAGVLLMLLCPQDGAAQDVNEIRDALRDAAEDLDLSQTIQGLTGFAAFPGVSAANFTVDTDLENASDADVTKVVLPLSRDFAEIGVGLRCRSGSRWMCARAPLIRPNFVLKL